MNRTIKLGKVAWIGLTILLLIFGYLESMAGNQEIMVTPIMGLFILDFPISFLGSLIMHFIFLLGLNEFLSAYSEVQWLFNWFVFSVLGYIQWFVLMPKVIIYLKKKW